ncbi:MAG: hypothetical protein HY234_01945 [Acidobacteria bacterium]|nr:hypothetical protein [Acidobacteriota bacterium]
MDSIPELAGAARGPGGGGVTMAMAAQVANAAGTRAEFSGMSARGIQVRLFLTCWIVYALHFSPFVTREAFLMMSVAERGTARVDEYAGMHSDLVTFPGRGTYMTNNPGASLAAAVLYWLAQPVMNRIAPVRPPKPGEAVSAQTKEERANRVRFYRLARERGLDVRMGAAASFAAVFFMAPLAALSAVLMWRLFGHLGFTSRMSLWLALLYAFGTPVFLRAGTLSLNLLVGLLGLAAFALLWWPAGTRPEWEKWRIIGAGFLGGYAVLTDYSGAVSAAALGLYAFALQARKRKLWPGFRFSLWYLAGAAAPVAFLLYWQWISYGNPWLPAQFHMPVDTFKGLYASEHGVGWPLPEIMWGLWFDPMYGLLVYAPVLALALYHVVLVWRRENRVPLDVTMFCWAFTAALWLFLSCIHYTIRYQWIDGVRYIVPVVPFLFLLAADVLARAPRAVAWSVGVLAVVESWTLAMVREHPMDCFHRVFMEGPELPWLTILIKTAPQYAPQLAQGASPFGLFLVTGVVIWAIWRARAPWDSMEPQRNADQNR